MLSIEECMDFCGLDCDEVECIAEHEHVPLIVAAELGYQMLQTPEGMAALEAMLLDNIDLARSHGQDARVDRYDRVYRHFVSIHSPARH